MRAARSLRLAAWAAAAALLLPACSTSGAEAEARPAASPAGSDEVRLVVTGHDAEGRAVFADDTLVAPIRLDSVPTFETFNLWSTDGPLVVPDQLGQAGAARYFPGPQGTVFRYVRFLPGEAAEVDVGQFLAEVGDKLPGLLDGRLEPEHPGMHTTDTVDYCIVVHGEVHLELDDGEELLLEAGSAVVQTGTRHRWVNRSDAPATVAFILVGATRR